MSLAAEIEALFAAERRRTAEILRLASERIAYLDETTGGHGAHLALCDAARHIEYGDATGTIRLKCDHYRNHSHDEYGMIETELPFGQTEVLCRECGKQIWWKP